MQLDEFIASRPIYLSGGGGGVPKNFPFLLFITTVWAKSVQVLLNYTALDKTIDTHLLFMRIMLHNV